jgi:hypothetical protein
MDGRRTINRRPVGESEAEIAVELDGFAGDWPSGRRKLLSGLAGHASTANGPPPATGPARPGRHSENDEPTKAHDGPMDAITYPAERSSLPELKAELEKYADTLLEHLYGESTQRGPREWRWGNKYATMPTKSPESLSRQHPDDLPHNVQSEVARIGLLS